MITGRALQPIIQVAVRYVSKPASVEVHPKMLGSWKIADAEGRRFDLTAAKTLSQSN
jgi:hypothetical protein